MKILDSELKFYMIYTFEAGWRTYELKCMIKTNKDKIIIPNVL